MLPTVRFSRSHVMRHTLLASAALALTVPAAAQTPAPADAPPRLQQEIFVTATIAPIEITSLTRSVAVMTRVDIDQLGLTSIVDALRLVPGMDVRARGPRDVQTDFSVRGATFGQHLVLADGQRLNDSQSGHHNGEIPLPAVAIDRIEVLAGAGSAVHGADALGGTINVITRQDAHALASIAAGQHGLFDAQGSVSGHVVPQGWTLSGWTSRSSGFMYDRDFAQGGLALRGAPRRGLTVDVRHQRRAFGANGFYGNSPSKEWTDGTIGSVGWQRTAQSWTTSVRGLVRNHGDHFLWDINRPGFSENRHRTNAVELTADSRRQFGATSLAFGASGGSDRVRSSNLGDHDYSRISAFAESVVPLGSRATAQAGARFDRYSTFGSSFSPTASVVAAIGGGVRVRTSVGHAFRVPTFTELYYSDPNTLGNADLVPEQGWTVDGGVDWSRDGWTLTTSVFRRWDADVIDFVRPSAAERYRATNIRDVHASGLEASVTHRWPRALVRLAYAGLDIDAPALDMQSRYVLEYATHQTSASIVVPIHAGVRAAINVDHRVRRDGQTYGLVGARVSRTFGRFDLHVDGTNLLDETYTEIAGVAMPGRWMSIGVTIR